MKSAGNASVAVLILVFSLSVIFLAVAAFSGSLARLLTGLSLDGNERALLAEEARKTIQLLCQDPTPEADSPLDPVWAEIAVPSLPDASVSLKDLSSRINPNSALDRLLQAVNAYRSGVSYEAFHKYRLEEGPLTDLERTGADFFREELLDKFFTGYAFFNVNTANESMLFRMYEIRTGVKATSTTFASAVRNKRTAKAFFTQNDLKTLLGGEADNLYPYISALPEMNVNLMDPDLLGAVLGMAKNVFKLELKGNPKDAILAMRAGTEITNDRLAALIRPKFKGTILESYLGCRTWFWGITVARSGAVYRAVAVRLPAPPGRPDKEPRFRLLEETFAKAEAAPEKMEETETNDE